MAIAQSGIPAIGPAIVDTCFKGQDSFVLKVCGSSTLGNGCSTLNYTTTVN